MGNSYGRKSGPHFRTLNWIQDTTSQGKQVKWDFSNFLSCCSPLSLLLHLETFRKAWELDKVGIYHGKLSILPLQMVVPLGGRIALSDPTPTGDFSLIHICPFHFITDIKSFFASYLFPAWRMLARNDFVVQKKKCLIFHL